MDPKSDSTLIPMFPLNLLPLPGELVPLHIFEPRYRQLLNDAETADISFGIFCTHECNAGRLGALMKLESVIKRYPGGESDIVVRCIDIFWTDNLHQTYKSKLYPGGNIRSMGLDAAEIPGVELYESFVLFLKKRRINKHVKTFSVYQVAAELNLELSERHRFITLPAEKRERFLLGHLRFQLHIMHQEEDSRDVYHLN